MSTLSEQSESDRADVGMLQTKHRFNNHLFFAYVVGSLAAVVYLPTLVPQPAVYSASYIFGYNNRVGIVLVLALVAIAALWRKGRDIGFRSTGASKPVSLRLLCLSLAIVSLGCGLMYLFAGRLGGFGESSLQIDRVWLAAQNRRPYLDFEYLYGVANLYIPILFGHLFHFSLASAYYLYWAISWMSGTVFLFLAINLVDYPTPSKRSIFLVLFLGGLPSIMNMGANYTSLRFTLPIFSILVVYNLAKDERTARPTLAVLCSTLFTAILLLISPETAIAHAIACVYLFSLACGSWAISSSALLMFSILFWIAFRYHVLDGVIAFSGGSNSFPISFAPHILLFIAALYICASYLVYRHIPPGLSDNSIAVIAVSVPMVAAALQRCDPAHVFWNGEGIFLASFFYISTLPGAWKSYRLGFLIFVVLLPALTTALVFRQAYATAAYSMLGETDVSWCSRTLVLIGNTYSIGFTGRAGRAKWAATVAEAEARTRATRTIDFNALYPGWKGMFFAPLGYKPNGVGNYLSSQVEYGRYRGFDNANTKSAIQQKVEELKRHTADGLLLPAGFESMCEAHPDAQAAWIAWLFAFPYFGTPVHKESLSKPFCDHIEAAYRQEYPPTKQNFNYGLWVVKDSSRVMLSQK